MAELDHLVYYVPDLTAASSDAVQQFGATPAFGGRHPGRGTHNALVSLGQCYLELIAPDPTQPAPTSPRPFGIDELTEPGFVAFAVRPATGETLDDLVATMRNAGADPGTASAMSRATPSGETLSWRLTFPDDRHGGVLPFLIDWGDTPKPHTTAPRGHALTSLTIATDDVDLVAGVIDGLGLGGQIEVTAGDPALTPHLGH